MLKIVSDKFPIILNDLPTPLHTLKCSISGGGFLQLDALALLRCFQVHEVRTASIGGKKQPPDWSRPPLLGLFIHFYRTESSDVLRPPGLYMVQFLFPFLTWPERTVLPRICFTDCFLFFVIEALIALTAVMVTRIYVELLRNTLHINVIHKFFFHFSNCFLY